MGQERLLITGGSGFIGANLIREIDRRGGYDVLNLDIAPAKFASRSAVYRRCDLLDRQEVEQAVAEFQPTHIVNLAGRTDMFGETVGDYAANHVGTQNMIETIRQTPSVENVVFTSSQYVVGPGRVPDGDENYHPHTIYGQSKVETEKAIRSANLSVSWTIIRPTNIWGRWHPRYPREFWRVLKQGRYVHPGGPPVIRCYGYVGNIVDQILTILAHDDGSLNGKTFYLGDPPVDIYEWTNAFSLELTGKPVRIAPRPVLLALAKVGDVVIKLGGSFPIYSSRFRSMTEDYLTPMEPTYSALGSPRMSLKEGVHETVEWLRTESTFWEAAHHGREELSAQNGKSLSRRIG
jgi:nucleoside-diphosphate-sugar epimerase